MFSSLFMHSRDALHANIVDYDPTISSQLVDVWRDSARRAGGVRSPCEGPEWTWYRHQRRFLVEPGPKLAVLYDGPAVVSVTPVMDDNYRLMGRGRLDQTLTGLRNSGSEFLLPSSPAVYSSFISGLFRASGIDYLRVRAPHDDAFVEFLIEIRRGRDWFLFIPHQDSFYYHWIDLSIGQETYWRKFNKKQRYNFKRELNALSKAGKVEFIRISSSSDVRYYAKACLTIKKKSWQQRTDNSMINNAEIDRDTLENLLIEMSKNNVLRSYLLRLGDKNVCFWTAFQHNGTFWLYDTGYDLEFASFSPGKCILQLIINNLFAHNTPRYLSFGHMPDDWHYKSSFATNYSRLADVLVIRNTIKYRLYVLRNRLKFGANSLARDDSPYEPAYVRPKSLRTD